MTVPVVPFGVVKSQVMALLGISRTAYGTLDTGEKRWSTGEIEDAIIDADVEFQRAICETDKHPRRKMFYQSPVALNNTDVLPAHIGPIGPLTIVYRDTGAWPGVRTPVELIRTWSNDLSSRTAQVNMATGTNLIRIISTTGNLFTESDIGKTIFVAGAGPSGGDFFGKILTVEVDPNAQTGQLVIATVDTNAGTTVGNVTAYWPGGSTFGGLDACEGAWDIVEDKVFFIGLSMQVVLCEVSRGTNNATTGLKSPLECINGIKGMALGTLFAKDSIKMDAAQYYAGYANMCLGLVREGKMTFPPLMQFETGRTV